MKLKSKKMKSAIEDSSFLFVSQKSLNAVFERLNTVFGHGRELQS
jgi:hypothetical protein